MRPYLYLAVLLALVLSVSNAQAQPGFHFIDGTPDTLRFFTNSEQSIAIYARNTSDVPLSFWADENHAGGEYGQWTVDDESFIDLVEPGALVKTVITYTPKLDSWWGFAAEKIYLRDTGFAICDSIFILGQLDSNLTNARALKVDTLLDFGKIDLGQSHTAQLLMKNVGSVTLTVDTMMLNGYKYVRQFAIDELPTLPFTLAPNQTKVIELTFTPNGSPELGGNDLMINYHIGKTFQTATVELFGSSGKFAAGSADTLDLGPIPMYAFVGKKVRLRNNLADSVEVYDYDPFSYPNLVVVMDSEGDSMVLGPQEEKEVIIYGLGMGFEGMEQEVQLEFTTHNGPLFHLGFVNVVVKTDDPNEDVGDPTREFPLMSNAVMFIPYGTQIEVFGGEEAEFDESLNFKNIEDHNISVTEVLIGDSTSTGYVRTNFNELPAVLGPSDVFTVNMDSEDTMTAAGWLLIVTDSSDVAKTAAVELPPIVVPTQSVKPVMEQIDVQIKPLGDREFEIASSQLSEARVSIFDVTGRQIEQGKNGMTWKAPSMSQIYLVLVEGKKNGQLVRRLQKLFVK